MVLREEGDVGYLVICTVVHMHFDKSLIDADGKKYRRVTADNMFDMINHKIVQ